MRWRLLFVALCALLGCTSGWDTFASVSAARDARGHLHVVAIRSHAASAFLEGGVQVTPLHAFQDDSGWHQEAAPFSSSAPFADALTMSVAPDGSTYLPFMARVGASWRALEVSAGDQTEALRNWRGVAWVGGDGRFRVVAPGFFFEFDGATRVDTLPLDLNCGSSDAFSADFVRRCLFAPSGDRALDLAQINVGGAPTRATYLKLRCEASGCVVQNPGQLFPLPEDAPPSWSTLLRTTGGTPTLACGVGSDVVVSVPGRQLARVPTSGTRFAFTARPTQGLLATALSADATLDVFAIDDDGRARRAAHLVAPHQPLFSPITVLGGMTGATEHAELFFPHEDGVVERITVSLTTGAVLTRESIAMLDD